MSMAQKQYVIFKLGDQAFGIDISSVREITVAKEATKVPNLGSFFEGIINMRGKIIPVVNLKKRLNIKGEDGKSNRIIISSLEEKEIGFLVDEASQVITLKEEDVDSPPEILGGGDKSYIVGIGRVDGEIIIMLDLIRVFSVNEKEDILSKVV